MTNHEKLTQLFDNYQKEMEAFESKGTIASLIRARKALVDMIPVIRQRRKELLDTRKDIQKQNN